MTARRSLAASWILVATVLLPACQGTTAPAAAPPASLEDLAKSSLATIDGEQAIAGLKEPVEILRDQQGIPHIYAKNDEDLFFAQGYVMAQDRLWQLELWRRWREGRLAEVYGPQAFDIDARTRLTMFRGPWDEAEWTSYHPDAERLFTAWANGLNAWVAAHPNDLPLEFRLIGLKPEPWTAQTVVLRWAQLAVDSVRGQAINEIQLALNARKLGVKEANRLAAPDPWDDLKVPDGLDLEWFTDELLAAARKGEANPFEPGVLPFPDIVSEFRPLVPAPRVARLLPELRDMDGSNNWVVSGKHTASGIPILSNDPHRTIEMPSLRYFVHLVAPGWNVIGAGEPPFVGVDAGNNEHMAWGFTFAGTDMVDVFVERTNPENPNQTRYNDGWEPMTVIREEIRVKGEAQPRTVELKFSKHGPVFYEDRERHLAFAVKSVNQERGTAPYKGSMKLAQAPSCEDFFDRAMSWKVPTHNLICGDGKGNIALQVSGLTPDRDGWNGRLPVPGTGQFEWKGFRTDLPREFNPERGYIATANDNTHPKGFKGRPVFYNVSTDVDVSRITRIRQMLDERIKKGEKFTIETMEQLQWDSLSLRAKRDAPLFAGWTSATPDVEKARAMLASWDHVLSKDTVPGAIYVRWSTSEAGRQAMTAKGAAQRTLVEEGLSQAIARATKDWGADWAQWRYGRINESKLPHPFLDGFSLPSIERPGGFNTVNATGANFRRIIDLSNVNLTRATNAPGQSAQPGSPYYGNLREYLASGEYYPLPYERASVEKGAAHTMTLVPKR